MSQLALRVDLAQIAQIPSILKTDVLFRLNAAVEHVTGSTASAWQEAVYRATPLWMGDKKAYADSITWKMVGDLKGEVSADFAKAREIEDGRPAVDLKRMLDTSPKVRTNKQGKRYLIIPFRHNTPGYTAHATDMPEHVYMQAKKLPFSKVVGMTSRLSGTGAWDVATKGPLRVARAKYLWGGRLPAGSMGPNPRGKSDRFAGMVRFEETSGKGAKSVFMTFRIMMEGQSGWIIPPRPGMNIAKQVIESMKPVAVQEFKAAVQGLVL